MMTLNRRQVIASVSQRKTSRQKPMDPQPNPYLNNPTYSVLCIVRTTQWTTFVRVQATATEKNGIVRSIKCVINKINTYVIQIPLEPRYEWVGFSSLVAVPIFIVSCKNQ